MINNLFLALLASALSIAGDALANSKFPLKDAVDQVPLAVDFVVMADTDHTSKNLVSLFGSLISEIAGRKPVNETLCVFIESDARLNTEYRQYLRGTPFESSVLARLKQIYDEIGRPYTDLAAERAYEKVLQLGRDRNIYPVAYDIDFSSDIGLQLAALFPVIVSGAATAEQTAQFLALEDRRHQLMADSIETLFRSNACRSGIVLAGEGHLQDTHSPPPFQDQFRAKGFSSFLSRTHSRECDLPNHVNYAAAECREIALTWSNIGYGVSVQGSEMFQIEFVGR